MTEYSEQELVLPTLELLHHRPGGLTTTDLIELLTERLNPDGHDMEILAGRQDTHFSQKVRNLVSHRTLQRQGLVDYQPDLHLHRLTDAGRRYLADSQALDDARARAKPRRRTVRVGPYRPADEHPQRQPSEPFEVDPNEIDRASGTHAQIQNTLAGWVQDRGLNPLRPEGGEAEFDLAWEDGPTFYVVEVKSLTAANETRQLRLGLGQVLHYRAQLLHQYPDIRPVLAIEREPFDNLWLDLCQEHGVLLVWPGVFDLLSNTDTARGD